MKKFRNFKARAACVLALSFVFTMCAPSVKVIADDIGNGIDVPAQTEIVSEETLPENGEGEETLPEDGEGEETLSENGEGEETLPENGEGEETLPENGEGEETLPEDGEGEETFPEDSENEETIPVGREEVVVWENGEIIFTSYDTEGSDSQTDEDTSSSAKAEIPSVPANFRIASQNASEVNLEWDMVDDVTGYKLYYNMLGYSSDWYDLVDMDQYCTSCKITFGATGTVYFKLTSYNDVDGTVYESEGAYQTVTFVAEQVEAPANVGIKFTSKTAVELNWEEVSGATEYAVWQSIDGGDWGFLKNATGTSAKVTNLEAGKQYSYMVKVTKMNGEDVNGNFSTLVYRTVPNLTKPGIKVSSVNGNTVTLDWDELTDADGYDVYTYSTLAGAWTNYGNTSDTTIKISYDIDDVYKHRVRGYKVIDGIKFVGAYSSTVSATVLNNNIAAPTGLKASSNSQGKVTLKWNAVTGATGYDVYVYSASVGSWKKADTVTSATAAVTHTSDGTYKYRVRAYKTVGTSRVNSKYSSTVSATVSIVTITTPTGVKISSVSGGTVTLKWNASTGAEGYDVYVYSKTAGSWKKYSTVTAATATIKHTSDDLYKYRVRAYRTVNGSKVYSTYSSTVSATITVVTLTAPTGLKVASINGGMVTLKWNEVTGASFYEVYVYSKTAGAWKKATLASSETATITHTYDELYKYRVRAYTLVNGSKAYSAYSSTVSATVSAAFDTAPTNVAAKFTSTTAGTLSWDAVEGANTYAVYVSTNGGDWTNIINTTAASVTVSSLKRGSTYSYKVHVTKYQSQAVIGAFSSEVNLAVPGNFSAPANVSVNTAANDRVLIAWDSVDGDIDGYMIEKKVGSGSWSVLGYVDANITSKSDSIEDADVVNSWRVTPYAEVDGIKFFGAVSAEANLEVTSAPVYRALLVGMQEYVKESTSDRPSAPNEVGSLNSILTKTGYSEVTSFIDISADEVYNQIETAFADADENDVSFFFYCGHGYAGQSSDYVEGALGLYDGSWIYLPDLAEKLSLIPGKVVVILQSCGSGAAVTKNADDTIEFEEAFNEAVISAFGSVVKSGDFCTDKFHVITAAAKYENAWRYTMSSGFSNSYLITAISEAVGYNDVKKTWSTTMLADVNGDGNVTWAELYDYCYNDIITRNFTASDGSTVKQHVQVYPKDSSFIFFAK